jgi:hypothetical protein
MSVARRALERLLERGETRVSRGQPETLATLALTSASFPAYVALRTLDEQNDFDAMIVLAQRQGAISTTRTREGGEGGGFKQLRLANLCKLAEFLDLSPRQAQVDIAASALAAFLPRFPVLDAVIQAWRQGKSVRGKSSRQHDELLDALRLMDARRDDERHESILRRESVRLFGDSKRIEQLTPWLDVLTAGELAASGLHQDEIWSQLGLRREPQPLLLSGGGSARVSGEDIPFCRPFIGLPIEAIESFHTLPVFVLTIENLTTFHDTAQRFPTNPGLIVYTGGMPSPTWRGVYIRLLLSLLPNVPIYHWGDIDEGGFRIAAKLVEEAARIDRVVQPWLMAQDNISSECRAHGSIPSADVLRAMMYWSARAGWDEISAALSLDPLRIEQEAIEPLLPV